MIFFLHSEKLLKKTLWSTAITKLNSLKKKLQVKKPLKNHETITIFAFHRI